MSPLRRQYLDIKQRHPDALLLFRLGDFYETFDDDAKIASEVLEIVLTQRDMGQGARVPMAGIPFHAADTYVGRLLSAGQRVAMCEQVGESAVRGLMGRQVVRVLSPGTIVEEHLLQSPSNNFLVAIVLQDGGAGLAATDVSTGVLTCTMAQGEGWRELLQAELARLAPSECITADDTVSAVRELLPEGCRVTARPAFDLSDRNVLARLRDHFGVPSLQPLGLDQQPLASQAVALAIGYVADTVPGALSVLDRLQSYSLSRYMILDSGTRRNLELTAGLRSSGKDGSVLGVLDRTCSAMGARCVRRWLTQPLLDIGDINRRLDRVEELTTNALARQRLRQVLGEIPDVERLSTRLAQATLGPRGLLALADGLAAMSRLNTELRGLNLLGEAASQLGGFSGQVVQIRATIADEPPAVLGAGTIRAGVSSELDELRALVGDTRSWIATLEGQERERSGVKSLKVGYNRVFGYFLEVSLAVLGQPTDYYQREQTSADTIGDHLVRLGYTRKQTLTTAERFVTRDLEAYEKRASTAQDEVERIERRLFGTLLSDLGAHARRIADAGAAIGEIDALASFAEVATRQRFTRPQLVTEPTLEIESLRHPVVEGALGFGEFTPNDITLDESHGRIMLVTGPNMAGKSTFLRQVAIATILAQAGSFVPASQARIGIADRVFTRIGAQDDLAGRQSTFMVEMVETAHILRNATPRSLVILDEVGRGTSTHDGRAVAQAVLEYLHDDPRLRCRTLFATHYHELAELAEQLAGLQPVRLEVLEQGAEVIFLHRVVPGGADRSYGVYVARLAGVPAAVANRAEEILSELEAGAETSRVPLSRALPHTADTRTLRRIRTLEPLNLTPLQALEELLALKTIADEDDAGIRR
ncbi:MAG: DNA mismatch repair protein MutS [Chloroflexota bacterium]